MRLITHFHRFHEGTPAERVVKVIGSATASCLLLIAATATLSSAATDDPTTLAFVGSPCTGITATNTTIAVTWRTNQPTDRNWIVHPDDRGRVLRSDATNGTIHTIMFPTLSDPGSLRIVSARNATGETIQSGDCAMAGSAASRRPIITSLAVTDRTSTSATIELQLNAPTTATATVFHESTALDEQHSAMSGLIHHFTFDRLLPNTAYTAHVTGDPVTESSAREFTTISWTTRPDGAEDTEPPSIAALTCTNTGNTIAIAFSAPEPDALGWISFDRDGEHTTIEALRRSARPVSVFTQTVPMPTPDAPSMISVTVRDRAGNTTVRPSVSCGAQTQR